MELRVLQYFLTIAREETISKAAEVLHITQPTLSRQMKDLEDEIGKQLFIRSNKNITLTKEGMILRQRASEIVDLVYKTKQELSVDDLNLNGEIYIGAGECQTLKIITVTMKKIQERYPNIKFHLHSGNAIDVITKIDEGLIDFGLITQHPKLIQYNQLKLPLQHHWGVLMRKDDPLAKKEKITLSDIQNQKLIVSKEIFDNLKLIEWFKNDLEHLDIVSTYTLLFNATLMVEEGLGYAICFDHLANTSNESSLCFKPLTPKQIETYYFIWKKYKVLTKVEEIFLTVINETIDEFKQQENKNQRS